MHIKTIITAALCLAAVVAVVLTAGCVGPGETPVAKDGDTVSVFYTLTVDGVEKESNFGSTPLEFTIGAGSMIKGFNDGVIGMKAGETKTIVVSPENGYGIYMDETPFSIPLSKIKKESGSVSTGDRLILDTGDTLVTTEIISVDKEKDEVYVHVVNHPLAGKTLTFTVMLDSITPAK